MNFSEKFKLIVNKRNVGDIFPDESDSWYSSHQRPFINAMIKLGYIERIDWNKLKKLKDIPDGLTAEKARELTKGIKLPKKQVAGTWGKIINKINNNEDDIMIIKDKELSSTHSFCTYESCNTYLMWLKNLEFIEIIKKDRNFGFKIKRLKEIPDSLTVTKAQKYLYDNMYKRSAKIDKIKEQMNNI